MRRITATVVALLVVGCNTYLPWPGNEWRYEDESAASDTNVNGGDTTASRTETSTTTGTGTATGTGSATGINTDTGSNTTSNGTETSVRTDDPIGTTTGYETSTDTYETPDIVSPDKQFSVRIGVPDGALAVSTFSPSALESTITIEGWFLIESETKWNHIISVVDRSTHKRQWGVHYLGDSQYGAQREHMSIMFDPSRGGPGTNFDGARTQIGKWTHIAVSHDGVTYRLFQDGKLSGSSQSTAALLTESNILVIGSEQDQDAPAYTQLNGLVDEVRISRGARYIEDFEPESHLGLDSDTISLFVFDNGEGTSVQSTTLDGSITLIGNAQWVSTTRTAAPAPAIHRSCKALHAAYRPIQDGLYGIDPDGTGPIQPLKLFCDMTNGGLTLVANIYDSAGDDAPNETAYVESGWQQNGSGTWANKASTVDRKSDGTGSAAVSLAFVAALKSSAGQKNLKMCFVHQVGYDTECRDSTTGSMTLVGFPSTNPTLDRLNDDSLTYTFGRIAGLMGSESAYRYTSDDKSPNFPYRVPVSSGLVYEFGNHSYCAPGTGGLAESVPDGGWQGVWHAYCEGMSYRPEEIDDNELGAGTSASPTGPEQSNPSPGTYGFRLYVGP